ncbi:transcriptional regulator with XRE-family HTH domain [Streptomyces sp. SAI-144]|uniref:helix-turn-helix domain-containing protein n=1 Tax=Streptomyces sp. SAI-144 TaxID=2940544 RepID=UPI0024764C04|nr:helix-turn-helix domain-containing protein [Streptomyces sp. SAI-144]MDH6435929.1 transcriptional regulator with XRE-family HTH domain [Streptomyces sp. SAI-144]
MTRSLTVAGCSPQRPFADLAQYLIALRRAARLPQRVLAEAANVSRGAVQRAESGTAAPTVTVLDAYLRACGTGEADRARARLLRTRGRTVQRDKLHELKAPAPDFITTKRDLALALAEVYERAGAPSLSDAGLTPGRTPLPRTTAWRIVNRKGLPASAKQLVTFLTACGISRPAAQRPYLDAYSHVIAQRGTRRLPPRAQRTQLIGRIHPAPLARGAAATGARYDLTGLAAALPKVGEAIAADRARFDLTPLAAALPKLGEAIATAYRSASREAHRNGTTAPDWNTAAPLIGHQLSRALADGVFTVGTDDRGIDFFTRTADGRMVIYEAKSHRDPPGPPPALPTEVPAPPSRPAPAARAG